MNLPKAVSVNDASQALGVSVSTLYRIFERGEIARRRIGGRTMISVADLHSLIDGVEELRPDKDDPPPKRKPRAGQAQGLDNPPQASVGQSTNRLPSPLSQVDGGKHVHKQ